MAQSRTHDIMHGAQGTRHEPAHGHGPAQHDSGGGILRQLSDELGITHPGPADHERSDERIREEVCERLWQDAQVDVSDVTVGVRHAVVTLEGTVPHRQMKHAIEDVAASCAGVSDVDNRLRVNRNVGVAAPRRGTS